MSSHIWQKTAADHHQTTCGRGRVSRLATDYYAIWTIQDGNWVTVKASAGRVTHRKSLPAAKHAVEHQLDRENQTEKTIMNEDQARANILNAMNDYVDQRATDREAAIRTIDSIGLEFPQLRLIADDAITTVLFRSFDLQQAA